MSLYNQGPHCCMANPARRTLRLLINAYGEVLRDTSSRASFLGVSAQAAVTPSSTAPRPARLVAACSALRFGVVRAAA
jgi:hypothetical protein